MDSDGDDCSLGLPCSVELVPPFALAVAAVRLRRVLNWIFSHLLSSSSWSGRYHHLIIVAMGLLSDGGLSRAVMAGCVVSPRIRRRRHDIVRRR